MTNKVASIAFEASDVGPNKYCTNKEFIPGITIHKRNVHFSDGFYYPKPIDHQRSWM